MCRVLLRKCGVLFLHKTGGYCFGFPVREERARVGPKCGGIMTLSNHEPAITVACPACGKTYGVPEDMRGRKISCKQCGESFALEAASPSGEPSADEAGRGVSEAAALSGGDACLVLGRLAIKHGFIQPGQLEEALALQRRERGEGRQGLLGSILLRRGFVDQKQLDFLLSVQMMVEQRKLDRMFGAVAVKNGFVRAEDMEAALKEQERVFKTKRAVRLIGEILVGWGKLEPAQRDALLERQKRLSPSESAPEAAPKEPPPGDEDEMQVSPRTPDPLEELFDVNVSEDGMSASVTSGRPVPDSVTVTALKAFLELKDVRHGLLDDAEIEAYLREGAQAGHPFRIAEGTPPQTGRDARIVYHFDTDPLKVGTIREGGNIDFRDKGEIPQVGKGDLLAERVPPEEGVPGTTVSGREIPPPKPRNLKLRKGKGTEFSEDGLQLVAAIGGRPEISADGKVYVFSEHAIRGDVDLKTGHVEFEGEIQVTGAVTRGFRIQGGSLVANEIEGAEVDVQGDVAVAGGIIGATIRLGGNLRARYIHKSRIRAFGDVAVEKEIIDAEIETSGACIVKSGPILSSQVAAKKGIEAAQAGSDTSNPCHLVLGTEARVTHEVEEIQERILAMEETRDQWEKETRALDKEKQKIALELGEKAQLQDAATVKKRQLERKIAELRKGGDSALLQKAEGMLEAMEAEIAEQEKVLEGYFAREDAMDEAVAERRRNIEGTQARIDDLKEEIAHLVEWAKGEDPFPVLRVHGKLFPFTTIKAPHTSLTVPEEQERIQIKEVRLQDPQAGKEWKLRLSPLT